MYIRTVRNVETTVSREDILVNICPDISYTRRCTTTEDPKQVVSPRVRAGSVRSGPVRPERASAYSAIGDIYANEISNNSSMRKQSALHCTALHCTIGGRGSLPSHPSAYCPVPSARHPPHAGHTSLRICASSTGASFTAVLNSRLRLL